MNTSYGRFIKVGAYYINPKFIVSFSCDRELDRHPQIIIRLSNSTSVQANMSTEQFLELLNAEN